MTAIRFRRLAGTKAGLILALSFTSGVAVLQTAALWLIDVQVASTSWPPTPSSIAGTAIMTLGLALALAATARHETGRSRLVQAQVAMFALLWLFAIGAQTLLLFGPASPLIFPMAALALLVGSFTTRRLAALAGGMGALVITALAGFDIEVLLVHLSCGLVAAWLSRPGRRPRAGLLKALALAGVAFGSLTALRLARGFVDGWQSWGEAWPWDDPWLMAPLGGFLCVLTAALARPLFRMAVGAVSRNQLIDLHDLDHPILQRLRQEAPGTWAHSRALADFAETTANAIGADAMLVRVGAYCHDIGKTAAPRMFVENQESDEDSPHNAMTPEQSAAAIMGHVVEGVHILREEGVPEDVVAFAYSHHGTSLIDFFWQKHLTEHPEHPADETAFRYPGQVPASRETGVLMLADAVEAAARTVDPPDRTGFQRTVERVVSAKLRQGQLDDSGLSIADLHVMVDTMVHLLVNMHHGRVKYPSELALPVVPGPTHAPARG